MPKGIYPRPPRKTRKSIELTRHYGITVEDFDRMMIDQQELCALCGGPPGARSLHIDHCHATGKVRGLLCHGCNTGMGGLRDDPALLRKAADYLEST